MTRRRILLPAFFILIVVSLLARYGPRLILEIRIDKCLDSGGAWNYQTRACERATKPAPATLSTPDTKSAR